MISTGSSALHSSALTLTLLATLMCAEFFSPIARAQSAPPTTANDQMGLTPYQSFHGGDIDLVNLSNRMLTVHAPFLSYPQRGNLKLDFQLLYNGGGPFVAQGQDCQPPPLHGCTSYVWVPTAPTASPNGQFGVNVFDSDAVFWAQTFNQISSTNPYYFGAIYTIGMADGTSHVMGHLGSNVSTGTGGNNVDFNAYGTFESLDGTGWQLSQPTYAGPVTITSPSGVQNTSGYRRDSNGNYISYGTNFTDTLGRQIPFPPTETSTGNANSAGCTGTLPTAYAVSWTPPGYNGGTLNYKFCYANIPINLPDLGGGGLQTSVPMLQSIVLPNGTTWTFAYNDVENGYSYGYLTQITLPTGGTISYAYNNGLTTRTVNANDGTGSHTWTYAGTTVTDPLGNDTVHTFTALGNVPFSRYETKTQYYAGHQTGGPLLKTVETQYSYSTSWNVNNRVVNVVPTVIKTTWPNNQVTQTTKSYDSGFSYGDFKGNIVSGIYGKVVSESDTITARALRARCCAPPTLPMPGRAQIQTIPAISAAICSIFPIRCK